MTRLDFITDFTRVRDGYGEPPDPFDGMGGPLDDWWTGWWPAKGDVPPRLEQDQPYEDPWGVFMSAITPEGGLSGGRFGTATATAAREAGVFAGMDEAGLFDAMKEHVHSWDKQVKKFLPTGGALRDREGGAPLQETDPGVFDLKGWQSTYENAKIPLTAMAKVAGTDFFMEPHAAAALRTMFNAAKKDGINLSIGNTYRDYQTQAGMYQAHVNGQHPAPVASPGTSNHGWGLAVDIASVGDTQFQWLLNNAQNFGFTNPWIEGKGDRDSVEPWHWEYQGGGDTGSPPTARRKRNQPAEQGAAAAPLFDLSGLADDDQPAFSAILGSLLQPVAARTGGPTVSRPASARKGGSTTAQLRLGFVDAGRGDLAKMVGTKDFQTWINAESGGRVDAVSRYFPNHGRNYGLFQFAQIHPWTEKYLNGETSWTADAYTQAQLVARYFSHLTPADIHGYAEQIRNGTYSGWG